MSGSTRYIDLAAIMSFRPASYKSGSIGHGLVFTGMFFAMLASTILLGEPMDLGPDEGFNLMKAALLLDGHTLYGEIWSDQPPVFALLLQAVFHQFGNKVDIARLVTLACSSGLVFAVWYFLNMVADRLTADIGAISIIFSPAFMKHSLAILIGLPAIAFAFLAMTCIILWHRRAKWLWLCASAALMGISVGTKFFTSLLVPIFILGLLTSGYLDRTRGRHSAFLLPASAWLIIFSAVLVGILAYSHGLAHLDQLVDNHAIARGLEIYRDNTFSSHILNSIGLMALFIMALWGGYLAARQQKWLFYYPAAWFVMACVALQAHRPVWDHQVLLACVPAVVLAAFALTHLLRKLPSPWQNVARNGRCFMITACVVTLSTGVYCYRLAGQYRLDPEQLAILDEMARHASSTHLVLTDRPIYAFRAGLPVHPFLVVLGLKRLDTGNLTEADVLKNLVTTTPEMVLLARFRLPALDQHLNAHYRLVKESSRVRFYVRKPAG